MTDDTKPIREEIEVEPPVPKMVFGTGEDLDANLRELTWLWPNWIPRGHLTILGGKPEGGKSIFMLELARRIYEGKPFPDGTPHDLQGQTVVWGDTESGEGITRDRMTNWEMCKRGVRWPMPPDRKSVWRLRLEKQKHEDMGSLEHLECLIQREPTPLLIIDSLQGAVPGKDLDKADTQTLLTPWAEMAQRQNIAIVILHHVRKGTPGDDRAYTLTFEDLRGTGALGAIARSVMLIDYPDAASGCKRLRVDKLNFCTPPPPLAMEIGDDGVSFDGAAPKPARRDQEVARAEEWLFDLLRHGAMPRPDVVRMADAAGFKQRTIDAAFHGDGRFDSRKHADLPKVRVWYIRERVPS